MRVPTTPRIIRRTVEILALAALAIGFTIQASRGQLSHTTAAGALVAKLALTGLCFAYAKALERQESGPAVMAAGESMLEGARHFVLGLAAQYIALKAGLDAWYFADLMLKVAIAGLYLLAFAYFIKGFTLLGDVLHERRSLTDRPGGHTGSLPGSSASDGERQGTVEGPTR